MKTQSLARSIVLFAALAVAGVCLIVLAPSIPNVQAQNALPQVGSALFAAGLAYFLIKVA